MKGEKNMTDHSPTSSDSPVPQQQPAGLLHAQFSCPICHRVVVSITGNELQYLTNHTHDVEDPTDYVPSTGQGTYASLLIYHLAPHTGPDMPEVQPGGMTLLHVPEVQPGGISLLPEEAFLIVQSLTILPHKRK
jgi:hypothetical protein